MAERLIEFYTSWPTEKIAETLAELSADDILGLFAD